MSSATYRNPFHTVTGGDPAIYATDAPPIGHAGHLIYQRLAGVCWDVVKDGVCVGQYAGLRGAKECAEQRQAHGLGADKPGYRHLCDFVFAHAERAA